jgi:hypothetical protein
MTAREPGSRSNGLAYVAGISRQTIFIKISIDPEAIEYDEIEVGFSGRLRLEW